ncbi:MAG: flagellar motor protein MotB [Terracidiphilus sp.]|nr:flagellar motor protein MotB [Terracidiphilus sp.]
MAAKTQPIIVIKKKSGHGGHHGGAWKVAYADFVTAMMSLFIVLWLMGSSDKVKRAVAGYFNDPKGIASQLGTTMTGTGETVSQVSTKDLENLKDKLEQEIKARKDLEKLSKNIDITITPEGLRIELIEGKNGTFYQSGSAKLSNPGQELLSLLASELKTLPNSLLIEGHTDATPYSSDNTYSNWDLSADRANSARRLLQQDGVRDNQVTQVRGYADQMLRVKDNPTDPSNRRISILVKNDTETVPDVSVQKILDHSTPLLGPQKQAAPPAGGASTAPAAKPGDKPPAAQPAPAPATPAAAPAPVPAKPAAAAAKPSLMDRLKSMLPGSKKTPAPASPPK